ncbi:MAG: hypothetical protein IJK64_11610 [Clostridia bacterium]|nr:hypothetical protein [Clostridia bacterium]
MFHTARTTLRRALAGLLCAALLFAPMTFAGAETAGYVYDPNAALAYAANHWNDGVGQCAAFVAACVTAGGIPSTSPSVYGLYRHLLPYGTPYLLTPSNGRYYINGTVNAGKVAPGDPLFFVCETCGNTYIHAALCSSIDSDGLHDYAHNNPHNNKIVYEDLKHYSHPQPSHKVVLYALHMSCEAPTVDPAGMGTATLSWDAVTGAESYCVKVFPAGNNAPLLTEDRISVTSCTLTLPAGAYTAEITANGVTAAATQTKSFTVTAAPITEESSGSDTPLVDEETAATFIRLCVQVFTFLINLVMRFIRSR